MTFTPSRRPRSTSSDIGATVIHPVGRPVDSRPRDNTHRRPQSRSASSGYCFFHDSTAKFVARPHKFRSGSGNPNMAAERRNRFACRSRFRTLPPRTMSVSKIPSPRTAARSSANNSGWDESWTRGSRPTESKPACNTDTTSSGVVPGDCGDNGGSADEAEDISVLYDGPGT